MNEANISWFDPRTLVQLTPAFGQLKSVVAPHGPKLIANDRTARYFDHCVHEGLLGLVLERLDGTYWLPDAEERRKLHIRVPLDYGEGCSIEPRYDGHWHALRSDLEKRTAIPVTPVARAGTPPASPTESPHVEADRDVGVADEPLQSPHRQPKRKPKRKSKRKPRRKAGPGRERIYDHEAITGAGNRVLARGRPDTKALFFEKVIAECRAAKPKIKLPSNIDVDDSLLRRVVGKLYDVVKDERHN